MAGTQRSSNLGKRLILVNMAWLLMPDGLVWECQKLMIYWDFPHTNISKILQRIKLCKKTSCWCQRSVESSQTTNELIGRRKAWVFVLSAKNKKLRLQFIYANPIISVGWQDIELTLLAELREGVASQWWSQIMFNMMVLTLTDG